MSNNIHFHGKTKALSAEFRSNIRKTLTETATLENYMIEELNYIFMSDDELLEINQTHLNHDDYTDIITFNLSDTEALIDGEIYISLDRVKENAQKFNCQTEEELVRVICHGLLHLLGYKDKTEEESKTMRMKEDESITLYKTFSVSRENTKKRFT